MTKQLQPANRYLSFRLHRFLLSSPFRFSYRQAFLYNNIIEDISFFETHHFFPSSNRSFPSTIPLCSSSSISQHPPTHTSRKSHLQSNQSRRGRRGRDWYSENSNAVVISLSLSKIPLVDPHPRLVVAAFEKSDSIVLFSFLESQCSIFSS